MRDGDEGNPVEGSVARDRLALSGLASWAAGTLVASLASGLDALRFVGAAVALLGLLAWIVGPLRVGFRRRGAGMGGALATRATIAILGAGTLGAIALAIGVAAVWSAR